MGGLKLLSRRDMTSLRGQALPIVSGRCDGLVFGEGSLSVLLLTSLFVRAIGHLCVDGREVALSSRDVTFLRAKDEYDGLWAWSGHQTGPSTAIPWTMVVR